MDFDAALELLGIGADTTLRTAKRAYLRQVKLHPPEKDPEGFRRVREAWDVTRSVLGESVLEKDSRQLAFFEEPDDKTVAQRHGGETVLLDDPLREYRDRAEQLEERINSSWQTHLENHESEEDAEMPPDLDALNEAYLKVWREACEAHPNELEPYTRLYTRQDAVGAVGAARAAAASGHFSLLDLALVETPELLDQEELDAAAQRARVSECPHSLQAVAGAYLAHDRPESATRLLQKALEHCADPSDLTPDLMVRAMLTLLANDDLQGAKELHEGLTEWFEREGAEHELLRDDALVKWAVVNELFALAGHNLPDVLRQGLARASLIEDDDDPWKVQLRRDHELDLAIDQLDKADRLLAWPTVQEHAPTLASWFADTLHSGTTSRYDAPGSGGSRVKWAVVVAICLFAALRFVASLGGSIEASSKRSKFFTEQSPDDPQAKLQFHADRNLRFGEVNFQKGSPEHRSLVSAIVDIGSTKPGFRQTARVFVATLAADRCEEAGASLKILTEAGTADQLLPMASSYEKYCSPNKGKQ